MSRITQPAADVTATGCSGGAKSAKAQAQFDTALQASVFDDQQAFLAALMDEQTLTQLEQLKQNLENQRRQAQLWSLRQQKRWHSINNTDLTTGWLSL